MRKSLRFSLVVSVMVCGMALGAANTVKEVTVRVIDQIGTDASDVLTYCSVQAESELSQEAMSKDVRALLDTGRFGYAGVELEKLDDGVRVVYVVRRRYRFQEPLAVQGVEYYSERKVRKLSELKSGDYIDEAVLSEKVAKIRDAYVKKYFSDVKIGIEIAPIENGAGAANVILTVEEGERMKIKEFRFTGNPSIESKELRSAFGQRPWYDPRGWFSDTPISAQDLEDARQLAEEVYHNQGYLDAKVAAPVKEVIAEGEAAMVFDVSEGDQYSVDLTAIRGVKLFPEGEVLAEGPLAVDAVAGRQAINDSAKKIGDYYTSRGYIDTQVRPVIEPIEGKPGRMAITYSVLEGGLVYINNIIIRGNNKTKDKVLRRELMVNPGEIMNGVKIERSENRLKNLGYFKNVRNYSEATEKEGTRDLIYEVEEQRTGNFMIGAGFSSIDNLVGFAEVSQSNFDIMNWPNFTGGGQKARLGVEMGSRRQTIEASVTEPWFLNRPLALTVEAYRRMRWYDNYDEIRSGASVGLSYPVKVGRIGTRYTLELVEMDDFDTGYEYDVNEDSLDFGNYDGDKGYFGYHDSEYGDAINSVIRVFWAHDTRDQPFIPTRGYKTMLFGEVFENGIGDNELYKMGAHYQRWYRMPWYKHVLSLKGRVETIDAINGDVPVYERLFAGGPHSIRGFEYRDVGPKVFNDNRKHAPMGGKTLALATAEYTIPIFKALRFATFFDVGSVGVDEFDPELSDVCASVGIGFRIDIPGFPIRFDLAKPITEDDDYTDEEVFSFAIGFE
ncbi:MAG: outer membrane protein assembly factor BamA [Kiritimatiellae bacterium]|nr:outer membrane protein assembly factor BamA [Kiritimatiellia bacterium]